MDRVGDLFVTGIGEKPWDEALLANVRAVEARLELARQEYAKLMIENRKLRAQLRECRSRLENWKLRREAWHVERRRMIDFAARRGVQL